MTRSIWNRLSSKIPAPPVYISAEHIRHTSLPFGSSPHSALSIIPRNKPIRRRVVVPEYGDFDSLSPFDFSWVDTAPLHLSMQRHPIDDPNKSRDFLKKVWYCNEEIGWSGNYVLEDGTVLAVVTDPDGVEAVSFKKCYDWLQTNKPPGAALTGGQKRSRSPVGSVYLINADCVNLTLALQDAGFNPMITNAGSRGHFGGGYRNGARAQEEELCRRSLLPFVQDEHFNTALLRPSLVPGAPMGVKVNSLYPIPPTDAIYARQVPFIRSDASNKYKLLHEPRYVSVGTVAGFNLGSAGGDKHDDPPLTKLPRSKGRRGSSTSPFPADFISDTLKYLTTLLTAALIHGHDSIVLVPVGCGAFKNPPEIIAGLLVDVILQESMQHRFKVIVVACLDDHNTGQAHNTQGNFAPFRKAFEESGIDCFFPISELVESDISSIFQKGA